MSKFAQIEGHDIVVENTLMELNYVKEGWGEAIGAIASFAIGAGAGMIGGLKAGQKIGGDGIFGSTLGGLLTGFLGFVGGFAGYILFNAATAKKFMKIINHPKVHEYLQKEADTILKEAKKEDKTLLTDYEFKDDDLEKAAEEGKLDVKGVMAAWRYMKSAEIKVGKYNVLLMGDREELKRIVLVLYSQKFNRLVLKDLPVPSREELKAMTADAAKESIEIAEEGWATVFQTVLQGIQRSFVGGVEKIQEFDAKFEAQLAEKFNKVLENDIVKNHIKEEADKLFAEEKKNHKKLTKSVSDTSTLEKEFDAEAKGQVKAYSVKKATHYLMRKSGKVGEYTVILLADPDAKKAIKIKVVFFDAAESKYITRDITAPAM